MNHARQTKDEGQALVEAVRAAARAHGVSWQAMVPSSFVVNADAEADEDVAFAAMADAKRRLRAHVLATYGVSIGELANLAEV